MRVTVAGWGVLGLLLSLGACALQSNLIQVDVGRASRFDVLDKVERILNLQAVKRELTAGLVDSENPLMTGLSESDIADLLA